VTRLVPYQKSENANLAGQMLMADVFKNTLKPCRNVWNEAAGKYCVLFNSSKQNTRGVDPHIICRIAYNTALESITYFSKPYKTLFISTVLIWKMYKGIRKKKERI